MSRVAWGRAEDARPFQRVMWPSLGHFYRTSQPPFRPTTNSTSPLKSSLSLPQQLIISFSFDIAPESTFRMSLSDMGTYPGTPGIHKGHDNIGCTSSCVGHSDDPLVTLEEINLFLRYLETGDEASRVTLLKMGWADAQVSHAQITFMPQADTDLA